MAPETTTHETPSLQQLFRDEGREQHDLQAHERGDFGLLGKHNFSLIIRSQPFQTLAIRAESQSVRTLQLADIDDPDNFLRKLRTPGEESELGVGAVGSRVEVHR